MSKLLVIPITLVIQASWKQKTHSTKTLVSLGILTIGVGLSTAPELQSNLIGLLFMVLSVLTAAWNIVLVEVIQKELGCTPFQLIHRQSLWFAVFLIGSVPLFDPIFPPHLNSSSFALSTIITITMSCACAGALNISSYFVIGRFSALTYQVVNHLKTILVIVTGMLAFNEPMTIMKAIGASVAVGGVVLYTNVQQQQAAALQAEKEKYASHV